MGGGAASAAKIIGQKSLVAQRKTTKVPNERLTARPGLRRECAATRTFGRQAGSDSMTDAVTTSFRFAGRREENQVS